MADPLQAGGQGGGLRFLPMRPGNMLVELPDLGQTLALAESLRRDPITGILELIPAARTVLIAFDPGRIAAQDLAAGISARDLSVVPASSGPLVEIPVRYDGEDLAGLSALLGIPEAEIVSRHIAREYLVAFTGFAPGFAYLAGGDPLLAAPRRKSPRTHVPAGALAIGGEFTGIYPRESPGGWQLIGSTQLSMFDIGRNPAALLQPGDRVRFVEESAALSAKAAKPAPAKRAATRKTAAQLEVLSTLLPILIQDSGRPGQSGQGVSVSGAADKTSYAIANRLVGNPPDTPALEISFGQVRFTVTSKAFLALSGAPAPMAVTSADGSTRTIGRYEVVALAGGETVSIGAPPAGLRSYLAARGGFDAEPVLGSASRDTLAQIGPAPILPGGRIGILPPPERAVLSAGEAEPFPMPATGQTITLDVTLGPRADWFSAAAVQSFLAQEWLVSAQSSRVGLRLAGTALARIDQRELPSEATLQGAIQVPAGGQPVLFLTDHPVTGGYPVIANVAACHLDLAGQLPPGARLRFKVATLPQM